MRTPGTVDWTGTWDDYLGVFETDPTDHFPVSIVHFYEEIYVHVVTFMFLVLLSPVMLGCPTRQLRVHY